MGLKELTAAVSVALSAAMLPGCEERGAVTSEGPNPYPNAGLVDLETKASEAFPKLFENYVREENPSDATLIAAHARAKEFAEQGKYFADDSYLPGGLRTWNVVTPAAAQKIFEGLMTERGMRFE